MLILASTVNCYFFVRLFDLPENKSDRLFAAFVGSSLISALVFPTYFPVMFLMFAFVVLSKIISVKQRWIIYAVSLPSLAFFLARSWILLLSRQYEQSRDWTLTSLDVASLSGFSNSQPILVVAAFTLFGGLMVSIARQSRVAASGEKRLIVIGAIAIVVFTGLKAMHLSEMGSRYICFWFSMLFILAIRFKAKSKIFEAALLILIVGSLSSLPELRRQIDIQAVPENNMAAIEPYLPQGVSVIYTDRSNVRCRFGTVFNSLFATKNKRVDFRAMHEEAPPSRSAKYFVTQSTAREIEQRQRPRVRLQIKNEEEDQDFFYMEFD